MLNPSDISRRGLLTGAGAAALLTALPAGRAAAEGPLPDLAPLGPVGRAAFAPAEQRVAPYLVSLAPMTNDISDAEADCGFFTGGWWRTHASATNARVQEHVLTLAWFYAKARSWNPYAGDPALLARLDAALGHYLGLQHADGSWPEYSGDEHSLAATGFALGYLSKVWSLLRSANALPSRRARIAAALRKAMTWLLDPSNESAWQPELTFSNQVTARLAGSALALRQTPGAALRARFTAAVGRLAADGQSPAGFFYEKTGADMNYNFEVMLPELADCCRRRAARRHGVRLHGLARLQHAARARRVGLDHQYRAVVPYQHPVLPGHQAGPGPDRADRSVTERQRPRLLGDGLPRPGRRRRRPPAGRVPRRLPLRLPLPHPHVLGGHHRDGRRWTADQVRPRGLGRRRADPARPARLRHRRLHRRDEGPLRRLGHDHRRRPGLHRSGGVVRFRWGGPRTVSFRASSVNLLDGARRTHILLVQHGGDLDLSIVLSY